MSKCPAAQRLGGEQDKIALSSKATAVQQPLENKEKEGNKDEFGFAK